MLRNLFIGALLALALAAGEARAGEPAPAFGGNLTFNPGTSSQQTALPASSNPFNTALLINQGSVDVHYRVGTGAPIAQLTDPDLSPGNCIAVPVGGSTAIAAITGSGSSTLQVMQFNGTPNFSCAGNSVTGGGATAANQVTGNTSLATIATNTTGVSTAANQTVVQASPGSLAGSSVSTTGSPLTVTTTSVPGSITLGGTAQNALSTNASRKTWCVQNPTTASEDMWVALNATASATTGTDLAPGAKVCNIPGVVDHGPISVWSATTGHTYMTDEGV